MISYRELREISLSFRRLSSNLLTATHTNVDVQLERFKKYIDSTLFINDAIQTFIKDTEFDYSQCFTSSGWGGDMMQICVPADEACHVKAMYDYMSHIAESGVSVFQFARRFSHKTKYVEIIQDFIGDAFKPLIDFINDAISKEMILIEDEMKFARPAVTQHIGTVYGTVNQQGTGTITSHNTTNINAANISELASKIIASLDAVQEIPEEEIDNVRDDLESISEQVSSPTPKKNRLQKALAGIKKFFSDFSMKLAVGCAVNGVTSLDWTSIIEQVETFIKNMI